MKILLDVIGAKVEADGTAWVWYDEPVSNFRRFIRVPMAAIVEVASQAASPAEGRLP